MKNFFKPARIAFYLLMLVSFFIVGLFFASYIEAGKNQGLAGGAIVLGYGVVFCGIAFIASFFIAHYLSIKKLKKINIGLLVLIVATWGYKYYEFKSRDTQQEQRNKTYQNKNTIPTETTEPVTANSVMFLNQPLDKDAMGIGFFKPNFYEHPTLNFYGGVHLEKGMLEHQPQDSLVMGKNQFGDFTSTYAPPYLLPEYMKLDYGLFYFKIIGIGHDLLLVEVNKQNGKTAYIDKSQGTLLLWPTFLMSVNTVALLDTSSKVKLKPLEHASEITKKYAFLKPLMVKKQWMQVALQDKNFRTIETGWIQWQKGGTLLISYDYLS